MSIAKSKRRSVLLPKFLYDFFFTYFIKVDGVQSVSIDWFLVIKHDNNQLNKSDYHNYATSKEC